MEQDLVAALLGNAELTAHVGTRINWTLRPQGKGTPALVLHKVASGREYTMDGRIGLTGHLVQMDLWADRPAALFAARDALLAALDALTVAPFQGAFVESERDGYEAPDGPQASGVVILHRASLDVRVWHHA